MTGAEALSRLHELGVRITLDGDSIKAGPRAALTDEARNLIREHRDELLNALAPASEGTPKPHAGGLECTGCVHLEHEERIVEGTRRRFWWTCKQGFQILEASYGLTTVLVAPEHCDRYEREGGLDRVGRRLH